MDIIETFANYLESSGFAQFHWTNGVMILIGLLFIWLAIKKGFEPLLLVPIGFGILIGNIPYDASRLPLGVYDGPVSEADLSWYQTEFTAVVPADAPPDALPIPFDQYLRDQGIDHLDHAALMGIIYGSRRVLFTDLHHIDDPVEARVLVHKGQALMVNHHSFLSARGEAVENAIIPYGQGRYVVVDEVSDSGRYPELWSERKQDVKNASVLWWLFAGVGLAGFYPPLIFLGIGALTDFGPMLSNPKTLLLGAAAQFGIFGSLLGALFLGFTPKEAASIGIIGGADGPTAIFTCAQLAPDLLGAVALAAYSYMAMVPIIQPPIIRLLTTKEERQIRMAQRQEVSRAVRVAFPIAGFLLTAFFAPGGLPLLGMLFFGNLLRESLVTDRLAKTAQSTFIDIVTILLGVTVGAKTSAASFLTLQTIYIFILGVVAFGVATAAGVIFGKIMNYCTKEPLNPMIGAAGVSAVPMSARVVHKLGLEEDPQNYLIMHAMGPNVAGVIGSAVAAGVLLSRLAGT